MSKDACFAGGKRPVQGLTDADIGHQGERSLEPACYCPQANECDNYAQGRVRRHCRFEL